MRHTFLLLATLLALPLSAQWSTDPAANLLAVDRAGEQTQPKLAPTTDGGFYLSWFDNDPGGTPAFGYDVYLQRFDAAGVEQWAHNGVLVADLGLSSTTDYDLAVDSGGNALLTFQDDRPTGTQITAARVSPSGTLLWGSAGVQMTSTTAFVANPKIVGTSDGGIVVAWVQDASVHVQRLDTAGNPQWTEIVLVPGTGSYATGDLDETGSGTCILSLVHQTGSFGSPRHLLALKLDAAGSTLWGPIAVFDGGSLQFGNFPQFVPDGSGGAVFTWYSASPSLQCFAQHIDANGAQVFPHNGTEVATNITFVRVSPAVAWDPATSSTYVFWVQKNSMQSQCGVSAQKMDASGARQWGPDGVTVVGLGTSAIADVTALFLGNRALGTWTSSPAFGQDVARAALLDASGSVVVAPFDFSSTPATKYRFVAEKSAVGFGVLAWRDERGSDPHVYLQNISASGTLGAAASATPRNGMGYNVVGYTSLDLPHIGSTWHTEVSHGHHPGTTHTLVIGATRPLNGPGLGKIGGGRSQLLITGTLLFVDSVASSGSADMHAHPIPADVGLIGTTMATQAVLTGAGLEFLNAIDIVIGP